MNHSKIIISVLILVAAFAAAEELPQKLQKLLAPFPNAISGQPQKPLRLLVASITFKDTKSGGEAAFYLREQIKTALSLYPDLELIEDDYDKVSYALGQVASSLEDFYDSSLRLKPGLLRAAQYILSGQYWPQENEIEVHLQMLQVETRVVVARHAVKLAKKDFPDLSWYPIKWDTTQKQLAQIEKLANEEEKDETIRVRVWPDRGDGATYKDGELIFFYVRANRNGHLRLYHIDVDGRVNILYPRQNAMDNDAIEANKTLVIPDEKQFKQEFYFKVSPPYGRDIIKAVFSTTPFKQAVSNPDLGRANTGQLRGVLQRGITTVSRSKIAEDECVITTIK